MTIAAIRFNNPGNVSLPIAGWSGGGTIVGIAGQSGYASFPDMATGAAALQQRLTTYIERGYDTIAGMNSVYAQDPNWKNGVSSASGIGLNTTLDPNNPTQMAALTSGIIKQETGLSVSTIDANTVVPANATPATVQQALGDTSNSGQVGVLGATSGGLGPTLSSAPGNVAGASAGAVGSIPQAIVYAADAATKAQAATDATLNQNTKAVTDAASTIAGLFNSSDKNLFTRGSMIVVGVLFIGGGLYLFGRTQIEGALKGIA